VSKNDFVKGKLLVENVTSSGDAGYSKFVSGPNYDVILIHSQSYDRLKNCLIFPIGAIAFFDFCE